MFIGFFLSKAAVKQVVFSLKVNKLFRIIVVNKIMVYNFPLVVKLIYAKKKFCPTATPNLRDEDE